jgi:mannose-6-phosphate isomerase-like protein (cupin superfamily)
MNPQITSLDPVTSPPNAKSILAKDGFTCSLIMLAPGDEMPRHEASNVEEHILFIVEGDATVRFDHVNTMLSKDEALLIPKGKEHVITAHPGAWAKILRIDVPPRQIITPPLVSFER